MAEAPILRIDLHSGVPAYAQIVGQMRTLLVAGELAYAGSPGAGKAGAGGLVRGTREWP